MTEAPNIIRREVERAGPIRFDRFMELALYCPESGYYERADSNPGRCGDFFTSVSVGPIFGELLASQFARWLEGWDVDAPCLVESGAHDGALARDILDWMRAHRPALAGRMRYVIVEPSARRRAWQEATLREFLPRVQWQNAQPGVRSIHGVIFSNELLDAFPIRRLGWDAGRRQWFEFGVGPDGERFVWTRLALPPAEARAVLLESGFWIPSDLERVLPDGFTLELCPRAVQWWKHAASALGYGWLLTLDYGMRADDFLVPGRTQGTLRAYRGHQVQDDVLADPGAQDLTAHVNFTALETAGRGEGLYTEQWLSQEKFLTGIATGPWPDNTGPAHWTPEQRRQFQTLTHPEHLGQRFRVLLQSRLPS
jgi:SAM-dependent MidA family methyltransferase